MIQQMDRVFHSKSTPQYLHNTPAVLVKEFGSGHCLSAMARWIKANNCPLIALVDFIDAHHCHDNKGDNENKNGVCC